MSRIDDLNSSIQACNTLIGNMNNANAELDKAYSALEGSTNIGKYYTISGSAADNGELSNIRVQINSIKSGINVKITNVKADIDRMNREIEEIKAEEARKAEEERKAEEAKKAASLGNTKFTITK